MNEFKKIKNSNINNKKTIKTPDISKDSKLSKKKLQELMDFTKLLLDKTNKIKELKSELEKYKDDN